MAVFSRYCPNGGSSAREAEVIKKKKWKAAEPLPEIGEKEKKAIEGMASSIINKLIHAPTVALREDSEDRIL